MDGVAGDGREAQTQDNALAVRVHRIAALARLYRLVTGMQRSGCPHNNWDCYWCGVDIYELNAERTGADYIGDRPGLHQPGCPWNEVIDYATLREMDRVSGAE